MVSLFSIVVPKAPSCIISDTDGWMKLSLMHHGCSLKSFWTNTRLTMWPMILFRKLTKAKWIAFVSLWFTLILRGERGVIDVDRGVFKFYVDFAKIMKSFSTEQGVYECHLWKLSSSPYVLRKVQIMWGWPIFYLFTAGYMSADWLHLYYLCLIHNCLRVTWLSLCGFQLSYYSFPWDFFHFYCMMLIDNLQPYLWNVAMLMQVGLERMSMSL